MADATGHLELSIILGILPLRTARHAQLLHHKVAGIAVPEHVPEQMRADAPCQ